MKCYPCHPTATDQRSREAINDDAATKNCAWRRSGERGNDVVWYDNAVRKLRIPFEKGARGLSLFPRTLRLKVV